MTNKLLKIFFLGFLSVISNCQNKENNKNQMINNTNKVSENKRLKDGITIRISLFKADDISLKQYKYKETYLEDIYINDLLDKTYRENFFRYLKNRENEDDFKTTLFVKLLMIRIQQLKDSNAFFLLSECSKIPELSLDGIELLHEYLIELFLADPAFFIKQGTKYNDKDIVDYIMSESEDYLVPKLFFAENMGFIGGNEKKLLLNKEFENEIRDKNLNLQLKKFPKSDIIFSPSLYSGWENKTVRFTNIYELFFSDEFITHLNTMELTYFKVNILPTLKKYMITTNDNGQIYTIQDPDGFINLRKGKSASSEILQKINSGEYISVLDNSGDWILVKTKEGKIGYVHKSRVRD